MPASAVMSGPVRPLDWKRDPLDLFAAWPEHRPLACLLSAGGTPRDRWSIFAEPAQCFDSEALMGPAIGVLSEVLGAAGGVAASADPDMPPFVGGLIGWISYDMGRLFELKAQSPRGARGAEDDRFLPRFELHHCFGAYVHDALHDRWMIVGDASSLPDPASLDAAPMRRVWSVEPFESHTGRKKYERAVARAIEYIRAGDMFQANLAHRLAARFTGWRRVVALELLRGAGARYGAYIEPPRGPDRWVRAVCSVSPELFLSFDPVTRRVETRPIKGTRALSPDAAADLASSAKDAAELAMIVDLMRNDLGRVCEYGSVRVEEARALENHGFAERHSPQRRGDEVETQEIETGFKAGQIRPLSPCDSIEGASGVVHGVATVSGRVREGLGMFDLMRAAFPPGSVTGAPKIRAMQIIDELEPVRRGAYCGCVGFLSDSGHSAWNVAIRTAEIVGDDRGGRIDYSVGAGIVADSDPAAEWEETIHKAGVLGRAFPGCLSGLEERHRGSKASRQRGGRRRG